jgi:hypothetical protein
MFYGKYEWYYILHCYSVKWKVRERRVLFNHHPGITWPYPIAGSGVIVAYWGLHTHFTWVTDVTVLRHFKFVALLKVCAHPYGAVVNSGIIQLEDSWWHMSVVVGMGRVVSHQNERDNPFAWCFRLFSGHNHPVLRELICYEVRMLVPSLTPHCGGQGVIWLAPCSKPVWHGWPYPPSMLLLAYVSSSLMFVSSTAWLNAFYKVELTIKGVVICYTS